MTEPTIVQALSLAMQDVRKVGKGDRNQTQNFNFRGVDRVMNAVGPIFRKHQIVCLPNRIVSERIEPFETGKGSKMYRSVITVEYRFHGPAGDFLDAQVVGEASDSLDKATSKAMSVAYRTALIQALTLPTGDPDPDSFSPPPAPSAENADRSRLAQAKAKVWKLAQDRGWDSNQLADHYRQTTGRVIGEATANLLYDYVKTLEAAAKPGTQEWPEPPADWAPGD